MTECPCACHLVIRPGLVPCPSCDGALALALADHEARLKVLEAEMATHQAEDIL